MDGLEDGEPGAPARADTFQAPPAMPFGTGDSSDGTKPFTADMFRTILDEQLKPIKQDIAAIKGHTVSRRDLDLATGPLKTDIYNLFSNMEAMRIRVTNMENSMNERMADI